MERALFHMDNSYKIPNIRGTGRMCKTNLPSNTAFRGFGGPQGMLIAEYWMSEVAVTCGLPAEEVSWEVGGLSQSGLAYFGARGNFYLGHLPWGQRISMCH
jgi:xanthine dehydrogenase/oxidase